MQLGGFNGLVFLQKSRETIVFFLKHGGFRVQCSQENQCIAIPYGTHFFVPGNRNTPPMPMAQPASLKRDAGHRFAQRDIAGYDHGMTRINAGQ